MDKFEELGWEAEGENRRLASLFRTLADRMRRCGKEWRGGYLWRCRSRCCPRCMRRKAKRDRRELERRLMRVARERLRFVTLMVEASDLGEGWRVLGQVSTLLRRRGFWVRAVVGGSMHRDVLPSKGERCGWNVHVHLLVELGEGEELDGEELAEEWGSLLADRGVSGSSDVRAVWKLWEPKRGKRGSSTLAYYVTRQVRREWLRHSADALAALCKFLPGKRLHSRFGTWRDRRGGGGRQPSATPSTGAARRSTAAPAGAGAAGSGASGGKEKPPRTVGELPERGEPPRRGLPPRPG